jgi:hypothetical protein
VLNVIQQQAIGNTDTAVSGVGYFAEVDESMSMADSASVTTGSIPDWDSGVWGAGQWG